eukprot:scaffold145694_cov121-Phaeocystis_antarctica.AAC.1
MSTQAIVSTLVFSMTMSKLYTDLSKLERVVDVNQTASTSEQNDGFALAQWYAGKRHTARCSEDKYLLVHSQAKPDHRFVYSQ